MRDEINERLDTIAEEIGSAGGSAQALNALHACRPGHPWNVEAVRPFSNLLSLISGRRYVGVSAETREWLREQAEIEEAPPR